MSSNMKITHYQPGDEVHYFTVWANITEVADEFGELMVLTTDSQGRAEFGVSLDTDKRRRSEIDVDGHPIKISSEFEDAILDECERFLRFFDKEAVQTEIEAQREIALAGMAQDDALTAASVDRERLVTYRRQVCIRQHQVWEVTVPAGMEISVDIADSLAFDDFVVAHGELVSHDDEDLPDDLAALEVEIAEVVPVRHLSV